MSKNPKRQKIKYKDKYKAYVYPIPNGVEYWRFWEKKSEIVYVLDPEDDHVIATYHKVARFNDPKQAALAERYFSESDIEVYQPIPEDKIEERLTVAYTADLVTSLFILYADRMAGEMTAEQLVDRIEAEIEQCSIAHKLPIITEQLDIFRDEPLLRHVYLYIVVGQFIQKRGPISVVDASKVFDVSYEDALTAFREIEAKGYIEKLLLTKSARLKGDWYKLKLDLSKYKKHF